MTPGKYNILCPQGTTLIKRMTYSIDDLPVDLTGFTARMQVRETYNADNFILELTTENGGIVLGDANGTIEITISHATTSLIRPKEYVYDLEIVSPLDVVLRLIEGRFIVTPEVTR